MGNNVVRHLLTLGRNVRVLTRDPAKASLNGLDVESMVGNVLDKDCISSAVDGVSTVFHLAGAISIDGQQDDLMRQTNENGTANVVEACLNADVDRLVHFSSIHALSPYPKQDPINETRELALDPAKHLAYDVSKAAGEQKVLAGIKAGLDAVIINPVGIFGPNDYGPSPGGEFLLQLMHRKLPGLVQAGYHWVDVRDVAAIAVAAESNGRCGQRYILPGHYTTFKQIANWVHETCGARPPRLNVPIWLARATAPMVAWYSRRLGLRPLVTPEAIEIVCCHQQIKTNKAADDLGFVARPIKQTISETVDWLQHHFSTSR